MKQNFSVALLAGASVMAMASAAFAQQAPAPTEEVVVTGSRVITNGNNSPTPLTVLPSQQLLQIQPTTLIDALNALPAFTNSRGAQSTGNVTGGGNGGTASASEINLRSLGVNRTLVLFDGQRFPSSVANGLVDVDNIPEMLLQRVDVVTGGVSAVYGSDAIAGVVNFVTDTRFNGLKMEGQYGISNVGDAVTDKIGIAGGTNLFGGRGHIEGSFEYYNSNGLPRRSDRPQFQNWAMGGEYPTGIIGTPQNPYILENHVKVAASAFGGLITGLGTKASPSSVLSGQYFATNGVLSPFNPGTPNNTGGGSGTPQAYGIGGDGTYSNTTWLAPYNWKQLYGRFDYDLTDDVKAHVDVATTWKDAYQYSNMFSLTNEVMSAANGFLPQQYATALAAAGQPTFTESLVSNYISPSRDDSQATQVFVNAGLDGKFGDGYAWGGAFDYGTSTINSQLSMDPNLQHLTAALDAVKDPTTGQVVCAATLKGSDPGCAPLNIFGPTAASAAAIAYAFGTVNYNVQTTSYDFNGHLDGHPISTWAGPVNMSVSGDWRQNQLSATSTATPTQLADCTNIANNCKQGTTLLWQQAFGVLPHPVSQTVWEVAYETDIPLLKDVPLAQALNLNGAVRYTDYSTSGAYTTWKIGMDWHLSDQLTLRATDSSDIRAPTLWDLFSPTTIGSTSQEDFQANNGQGSTYATQQISQGNTNLKAETSQTVTAGLVYRPSFLPRFSFSVDAFDINVSNAITNISGFNQSIQLNCYRSGGTSPYCKLIQRADGNPLDGASLVTAWISEELNISQIQTYGADFEANYAGRAFDRPYSVRALLTYQPHLVYVQPSATTIDMGDAGTSAAYAGAVPSFKWVLTANMDITDNLNFGIVERGRNELKTNGDDTIIYLNQVAPVAYTALNLTYKFKNEMVGQSELFLNVENLFNVTPAPSAQGTIPGAGFVTGDDIIGRYFTLGFRLRR
ncbi:MAG TPA: TonB-dependent receptor [Caulobacteraceae bacterium]|nr:TonB-dependent receptor [Caulobacteraceae bacterium]